MADITFNFEDNSEELHRAIEDATVAFLFEASAEIVSAAARGSRVDTGQLKGSWKANVDESSGVAVIGSDDENAIWEEFGTGIYAEKGGRKTAWSYQDRNGNWHKTKGKKAQHTFKNAYDGCKNRIINRAKEIFGVRLGDK